MTPSELPHNSGIESKSDSNHVCYLHQLSASGRFSKMDRLIMELLLLLSHYCVSAVDLTMQRTVAYFM